MALNVHVVEKKPRFFVVSLSGKLDGTTYAALEKKVDYLLAEGEAKAITLDLAGLEFISSMGVRVVFMMKKELARRGGAFYMVGMSPQITKVFEIIDALPGMQIFSSIQEMDDYLARMQSP